MKINQLLCIFYIYIIVVGTQSLSWYIWSEWLVVLELLKAVGRTFSYQAPICVYFLYASLKDTQKKIIFGLKTFVLITCVYVLSVKRFRVQAMEAAVPLKPQLGLDQVKNPLVMLLGDFTWCNEHFLSSLPVHPVRHVSNVYLFSFPSPPASCSRLLPLPELGSARSLFLLKESFSSAL